MCRGELYPVVDAGRLARRRDRGAPPAARRYQDRDDVGQVLLALELSVRQPPDRVAQQRVVEGVDARATSVIAARQAVASGARRRGRRSRRRRGPPGRNRWGRRRCCSGRWPRHLSPRARHEGGSVYVVSRGASPGTTTIVPPRRGEPRRARPEPHGRCRAVRPEPPERRRERSRRGVHGRRRAGGR